MQKRLGLAILNTWIVFHFFALCTAPASVPPSTAVARNAWEACSGYLQALYLNHAYHFFAPEPGGASLLAYEGVDSEGDVQWNRIPNESLWPRLRYHRHFVLTDHMAAVLEARPDLKEELTGTFSRHLAKQTGCQELVLSHIQHELSTPEQYRSGRPIDDPITYNELWLGEFKWEASPNSQ